MTKHSLHRALVEFTSKGVFIDGKPALFVDGAPAWMSQSSYMSCEEFVRIAIKFPYSIIDSIIDLAQFRVRAEPEAGSQ
jgi:hypothetical protein